MDDIGGLPVLPGFEPFRIALIEPPEPGPSLDATVQRFARDGVSTVLALVPEEEAAEVASLYALYGIDFRPLVLGDELPATKALRAYLNPLVDELRTGRGVLLYARAGRATAALAAGVLLRLAGLSHERALGALAPELGAVETAYLERFRARR
jgi:hypothetical protein